MPQIENSFKCGTIMRYTVLLLEFFCIQDEKRIYTGLAGLYFGMLPCPKTRRIYLFVLCKPGEERFSERSEAVVLLALSKGAICRLIRVGSYEILDRGGRLVGAIPSSNICILVWGRGWSVRFVSYDFLLV